MTKVIFKKKWWKHQQAWEVYAFFPDAHVNPGNILCYAHCGQHSEASREFFVSCKPCYEKEYAELKKELETVCQYDDLKVVSKWMRRDQELAWYPERFKDAEVLVSATQLL